jgi:putative DNA-invertase from lambdoid prophage Rac
VDGELIPHEDEQGAIKEMVTLKAAGKSLRAISAVMIMKGHRISHETVAAVLRLAKP